MAQRKRKRKSTSRKPMSQSVSSRVRKGRRRSSSSRSKIGLSEAFNPQTATATGKLMLKGAIVGYGIRSVEPMLDTLPKGYQHAILLGGSFLAGAVLKMDGVSNSIATIWGYKLANDMQSMNDDADWADQDALNEEEEYMDEAGNPMFLADDGEFYYLDEVAPNGMVGEQFLAEEDFYPEYANVSDY